MKKIEDNNTLVFIVDVRSNKRQISMVSTANFTHSRTQRKRCRRNEKEETRTVRETQ